MVYNNNLSINSEGTIALDNDQLKRRQAERARRRAQARQQQSRRKKIILAFVAILAVFTPLMLFAIGVIKLPGQSAQPTEPDSTTLPPVTEPEVLTEDRVIHLVAGGDVNITDKVVASGAAEGGYNYTDVFLDVVSVLAGADAAMLNFEGVLTGEPYGSSQSSAPRALVEALGKAGIDILQMANSCTISGGLNGLKSTLQGIRNAGMEPVGAFADSAEFEKSRGFLLWDIAGIRVAVVAFTKGMDGMGLPAGSEHCVNVLYKDYTSTYQKVDTEGITRILRNVAAEKPDITIALLHWGSEFNDQISTTQEEIRDLMYAQGVDAIIGTHPHYVQQMSLDPETGNFIAYSLGDFLGDGARSGSNYSVLLDLEITKSAATGETKITGYGYTPIFLLDETQSGGGMRILRIREAMSAYEHGFVGRVSEDTYNAMAHALERIEARVNGE